MSPHKGIFNGYVMYIVVMISRAREKIIVHHRTEHSFDVLLPEENMHTMVTYPQ